MAKAVGGFVLLLFMLPAPILITIAVIFAIPLLISFAANRAAEKRAEHARRREEEKDRLVRERAAAVATAKRKLEEKARLEDKRRVDALGKHGAALVDRAKSSVQRVLSSEAAREGWLGDIKFVDDIEEVENSLLAARAFRRKAEDLSRLRSPNDDDRNIVADAKTAIGRLERMAKERVELLERCATEAHRIDESLHRERDDARVAAQREKLHGELAAMLYGIDAAEAVQADSAADGVLTRVQAYRAIKGQIERARDDTEAPTKGEDGADDGSAVTWIPTPIRDAWHWIVD